MKPNVLFIVMDTARATEVSHVVESLGDSHSSIGRLMDEGTRFTNAFATAPWTLPSHASMFTGMYPSKHGTHAEHKSFESSPTLAEVLGDAGYDTVGVTNNVWVADEFGFDRGFDELYKTWQYIQSSSDFGKAAVTKTGVAQAVAAGRVLFGGNPFVNLINGAYGKLFYRRNDYGAKRTNGIVRNWISSREREDPFFMFPNYLEPHIEYQPPEAFAVKYLPEDITYREATAISQDQWGYIAGEIGHTQRDFDALRGLYRAEIAYLDYRIGELRAALETAGEWEDTVVVLAGDHGENIGEHGLMDHQYSLHDTLLHVPLVIAGGEFNGGRTTDSLVQLHDLFPTLLDVADADAPEGREQSQGRSLVPSADADERDRIIAEYIGPQPTMGSLEEQFDSVSDEAYRYDRGLRAIRTEQYKLIVGSDGTRWLYDIEADPAENENIVEENPEQTGSLERELDDWLESFDQATTDGSVDMSKRTKRQLTDLGYL